MTQPRKKVLEVSKSARELLDKRRKQRERREYLKGSFAAFVRESWDIVEPAMPLIDNWHIDALAEHDTTMTVWTLAAGSNNWVKGQVLHVAIKFGSSS